MQIVAQAQWGPRSTHFHITGKSVKSKKHHSFTNKSERQIHHALFAEKYMGDTS